MLGTRRRTDYIPLLGKLCGHLKYHLDHSRYWRDSMHPKSHLDHSRYWRDSQFDLHPGNSRYPFSAGWTGGMVLGGYSQQINAGEKEDG